MPFVDRSTLTYPATNSFPVRKYMDDRNPTTADFRQFQIFDLWINHLAMTAWIMVDRTASAGTWIQMASTGTGILTITGDAGGAVGPDGANNINLLSGAHLTVTGNAGTNTLTITLDNDIASTYTANAGSATPAAGNLNVLGAGGILTSGAGSTLTITAGVTIATTYTTDAGAAVPAANNLNVLGGTLCGTTGAGSTVTVNVDATVASTYTCDAGSATPAANNLNVIGGGGTSTTGAGSTITITSTGGGLPWTEVTIVGPTQTAVNNGYVTNNGARVQLLLPLLSAFGSNIRILGKGAGGWQINQNAGQNIVLDSSSTTVGVAGTLQSDASRDSVDLICTTANTTWTISDGIGNYIFT
jgi:hypothetical protein